MGKISRFKILMLAVAGILGSSLALAQEGYPLNGTWRGTRVSGDETERVLLIMKWDGDSLGGMINPGPNSVPFQTAELDAPNWILHVEAQTRDGEPIMFTAVLENVGAYNRTLEGSWTQNGKEYSFKVTRE